MKRRMSFCRERGFMRSLLAIASAVAAFAGVALPPFAAEVEQDEAREAVRGWAALRESLADAERFAGAEIADVMTYAGKDGLGKYHVVSFEGLS